MPQKEYTLRYIGGGAKSIVTLRCAACKGVCQFIVPTQDFVNWMNGDPHLPETSQQEFLMSKICERCRNPKRPQRELPYEY